MTDTATFTIGPAPVLSEADRRRVAIWLQLARPSFQQLCHDAGCAAAADLIVDLFAYAPANRTQDEIASALFSRALTEKAKAIAIGDTMQPDEHATAKALGLAMEGVLSEPDATATTAERLILTPISPADEAYLLGRAKEAAAALEPKYAAGQLLPQRAKEFERLRKKLAELVATA
jgi:hypothetical protein